MSFVLPAVGGACMALPLFVLPVMNGRHYRTIRRRVGDVFSPICGMQIPRFTSSKPSEFAFASDEKSIRQPTASLCGVTLNLPLTNHIPKEALSSPLPGKGALTHHLQADGGIPPVGRARALSDGEFRSLRRATGNSANLIPCTKNAAAGRSTAAAFFVMTQHCR